MVRIHSPRPLKSTEIIHSYSGWCRWRFSRFFVTMPKTMPTFYAVRSLHRGADGFLLGMDVALRRGKIGMSRKVCQRIRIHVRRPSG